MLLCGVMHMEPSNQRIISKRERQYLCVTDATTTPRSGSAACKSRRVLKPPGGANRIGTRRSRGGCRQQNNRNCNWSEYRVSSREIPVSDTTRLIEKNSRPVFFRSQDAFNHSDNKTLMKISRESSLSARRSVCFCIQSMSVFFLCPALPIYLHVCI